MSSTVAPIPFDAADCARWLKGTSNTLFNFFGGLGILLALWWLGIYFIASNPATQHFADFGPGPAFEALLEMWHSGQITESIVASGLRLGGGMLIAAAIGIPVGIWFGRSKLFHQIANAPFQLGRMISPLSWEPIAVIVFLSWEGAIIFLVAIGAVWPILFSTAAGLAKVDPNWFKVARNLGANRWHVISQLIMPAIAFDVFNGLRLALGVAWIVLVPSEFFGVQGGLGYSIEDARESLQYDHLMATIVVIGAIGYVLDTVLARLVRHYNWQRQSA